MTTERAKLFIQGTGWAPLLQACKRLPNKL